MSEHCVVYITAGSQAEAQNLATTLVQEQLAACVNQVGPVQSTYIWEGALQQDSEFLLIAKTRQSLLEALISRVQGLHSYAVPEVIALPIVAGLPAYLNWITQSTSISSSNLES